MPERKRFFSIAVFPKTDTEVDKKKDGPLLGQQYLFKVGMSALFARVNNELLSRTFILKQLLAVT